MTEDRWHWMCARCGEEGDPPRPGACPKCGQDEDWLWTGGSAKEVFDKLVAHFSKGRRRPE